MAKQENETVNMIAAFTFGGILGAGIALLLAPQSGKDTRKSLIHMGEIAQKRSKRYASELVEKMDYVFNDIRDELKSRMNDGKSWTEEKMKGIEQVLQSGKTQMQKDIDQILHS
jgi:gas vesicle protein